MHIGFLSTVDPNDPDRLSGMPAAMKRSLTALGAEVSDLVPATGYRPTLARRVAVRLLRGTRRLTGWRDERHASADPLFDDPSQAEAAFLARAAELSSDVAAQLDGRRFDLLFGCCVSTLLFRLETDLPIVYAGDTTARLINRDYPEYQRKPAGYHRATDCVEATGLGRVAQAVFATQLARASAIEDYGLGPELAHVVPMGANIAPDEGHPGGPKECPERPLLRLAITAIDPVRKQTDLVVEITERLVALGWQARLTVIGHGTDRVRRSPVADATGFLRSANPLHRELHREALQGSHLLLQPSLGEAFGIAPCEAAQWGVPSLVSDTGGLPEVVAHGETGLVLPRDADADAYVKAITRLVERPEEYRRMSRAAWQRAGERFTWERWGEQVAPVLEAALGGDPVSGAQTAGAANS